jgi:hypothetical protein
MSNNNSNIPEKNSNLKVKRPTPIVTDIQVLAYDKSMNPQDAISALLNDEYVLIVDYYSTGLSLLSELKKYVKKQYYKTTFKGQRDFRGVFHKLSNNILLDVSDNKLNVKKAPKIGWLKKLYPEYSDFALSFPKVQGLNSSWQWYENGIYIPVIDKKIHPYYGTYFPTRFEHLELFNDWISKYNGEKQSAYDIGIGSGILSDMLLNNNFENVIGTDINQNAIIGLTEENKESTNLELIHGNLFSDKDTKADLIVFNPPWLPTKNDIEGLDTAIYYNDKLFPAFFKEAKKHLKENGKLVVLFSNIGLITKTCKNNPIDIEISNDERFKKDALIKKSVKRASSKTKRDQEWRSKEEVELWILSHKE